MPVKNKIRPPRVQILDPDNNSLGFFNEYEFMDFRIQIKDENAIGYKVKMSKNDIREIDQMGRITNWDSLFDLIEKQYGKLL